MSRNRVVLPQPEGPSRKNSSWSPTSREMSFSTGVPANFLLKFWSRTRMVSGNWLRERRYRLSGRLPARVQSPALRLPPPAQVPVLALRPGLPLDLLAVAHNCLLPGACRQLQRLRLAHRHPPKFRPVRVGRSAADHLAPGGLQFGERIDQQGARQRGDHLPALARQPGIIDEVLLQLEGREIGR